MTAYSASRGRKFALTLAIAFGVLAALSYWRGRHYPPLVLGVLALLFAVAGLALPSRLEPVENAWMKLAHAISRVTTPVFMGIVYFVLLTPVGFFRRIFGSNPLVHRAESDSYWKRREPVDPAAQRRRMERQF
jgi:hypothetical protein